MQLPEKLPTLEWSSEVEAKIFDMAISCGLSWTQTEHGPVVLTVGARQYHLNAQNLSKRLFAELLELVSSRIQFGYHEHHFHQLSRLTAPVLKRAVAQGLREREGLSSP